MTNYPPTPAFGGFPLPAPRGPPGLSQDLRKLSINSVASNSTTLPSPAIQSPNYVPKFHGNISASRQSLPGPLALTSPNSTHTTNLSKQGHQNNDNSPEDREEGELSDAEDLGESHLKKHNNRSGSRQRDRGIQNQQGKEFISHGMRANGEASNRSPIPRSQTWNEPYRRESISQGWNQQATNRKRSFDMSSAAPPKAPRGDQLEKKIDSLNHPKGNFRDRKVSGSGYTSSLHSASRNQSPSFYSPATVNRMNTNSSPVHVSTPQSPLGAPKTAIELRNEAQRAVLNMLPLKVTFKYMVEEAGIDPNVLKKVFTGIGLPLPTETPSPSPSGDIDHPHRAVAKHKPRDKSSDRMEIDKDAQVIRKQLEKDARDRERREAEAKAAELVRQREAAKEEEEKKRRLAEVEAKKEVLRRKIDEMKLPGKSASPGIPLTPISSTPVAAAIARAPPLPPPKPEVPRIPGLLLGQLDGSYSESVSSPEIMPEQSDTLMKDSPEPSHSSGQSTTVSTASNISPTPLAVPPIERPLVHRRKRPVASDMYSEPRPTTKRKFGDQRKAIELIIDISDEEEEEEEGSGDDSGTSRSTPSGGDYGSKSSTTGNNTPPRLRTSLTAPTGSFTGNGTNSKLDSAKALQDKEEQIRALKEAIQKAQQKKKLAAKTGMSTPTSVGTPGIEAGPSVPPPLTQKQQQVTDVAVAVSSALDKAKKDETTHHEEKQKVLPVQTQAAQTKVKANTIQLKESQKKEKEKKMKALITEIEEIEKSEAEKRRKKAEEIEVAEKKRQQAKEEMERKLKEAESQRLRSRLALEKVRRELERMQREESEMEAKKEALKAELAAMEQAVEQKSDAMGEVDDEAANAAISKKKEEIEQLKRAMEEVDQINFEAAISTVSTFDGTISHEHKQLTKFDVSEDPQPTKTDVQDDVAMADNIEPKVNGSISTYQKPHTPVLERTEITASHAPAAPLSISANSLEDAMDVDQRVNEEEEVNESDIYINDVDMDARSDEDGGNNEPSPESSNEVGEIPEQGEEENDKEGKHPESEREPQFLDRESTSSVPEMSLEPVSPPNMVQNYPEQHGVITEEANLPISVPEQGKQIEELVDPTKITITATTSVVGKEQRIRKQPQHTFTPYKSPLTNFKSFRYHPHFLDFCPGGYRSLTFSNRIDPKKPLCRWELSGGVCSDTSCTEQHQRQFEIPDDEILVELASVVEGSSEEERNNYNRGLRQAIAAMREQGIKDFETVVAGIASYRRRFLGDETRVIRLPQPPIPPTQPQQQRTSFYT